MTRLHRDAVASDGRRGLATSEEFQSAIEERIELGRRYGVPFSLVLLEAGHLELAGLLGGHIRRSDVATSIPSGQFALILSGTGRDGARHVANSLRQVVAVHQTDGGRPDGEVRTGTACFPEDAEDVPGLLERAQLDLAGQPGLGAQPCSAPANTDSPGGGELATAPRVSPGRWDGLAAPDEQAPLRVLVVDDEESLRDVVAQVLQENSHVVDTARSGEEALVCFREGGHQLVITDIRMGGMDGIELLRRIKTESPDTQVVIMTSYASLDTATEAMRAGAYDYLIKPFEELDLVSAMAHRAAEKIRLIEQNRSLLERLRRQNEQLRKASRLFRELAVRDGLTGLHNHRRFQEALGSETQRSSRHGHRFSVILLDVDHFKQFNDTHGHPKGDDVLRALAKILKVCTRCTDLTARYGGEEFVLLLPETGRSGAAQVAERVRRRVAEHPFAGGQTQPTGRVTLSIGVATFPEDAADGPGLVATADEALYRAKHEGRNRICTAGEA